MPFMSNTIFVCKLLYLLTLKMPDLLLLTSLRTNYYVTHTKPLSKPCDLSDVHTLFGIIKSMV